MVGTFYAAPSPEAPPFVKVGDHVMEDTVVCVIEAMKVFNEIRAETSGTIEKILGKNAAAVEFGQALFVVRPDS
jgi:acetyl-CoA carboxylase biotin carboxyl carrier protein